MLWNEVQFLWCEIQFRWHRWRSGLLLNKVQAYVGTKGFIHQDLYLASVDKARYHVDRMLVLNDIKSSLNDEVLSHG